MDLRQLRCFLAVAETLSYRDAAERLGISAPPLYKHVNRLQSKVGAPLFNRRERKLELIAELARDFTVLSEVGSKDAEAIFAPYQWVQWIKEELDAA